MHLSLSEGGGENSLAVLLLLLRAVVAVVVVVGLAHIVVILVALEARLEARAVVDGKDVGGAKRWKGDCCR